ncbi:hypothetical protein L1887_34737 [Cichorium endivia]|nr:hypothetical protein L1887_34737 [Cichorium endivia]
MSTTMMSDAMVMPATEFQPVATKLLAHTADVEFVKCDCCGLTEECTPGFIERIRERYQGKWICGLCGEAICLLGRSMNKGMQSSLLALALVNKFFEDLGHPSNNFELVWRLQRILGCPLVTVFSPENTPKSVNAIFRADKSIMASSGFQADVKALQKVLASRHSIYQHQHNKQMSCPAMAQLLSNTLYYKRFFPYYTCNVLGGLDSEGKGCHADPASVAALFCKQVNQLDKGRIVATGAAVSAMQALASLRFM